MNTKFQYEQIGRIYDERRFINRNLMEDRKEEIRKAIPEFEALERSISETAAYDITAIIGGSKNALVNTKNRLREIENTKKSLLVTYHYPKNYLDPIYNCNDCQDTGYINNNRCHCFKEELLKLLYNDSKLEQLIKKENFETFNLEYYPDDFTTAGTDSTPRDNIRRVLKTCHNYIDNFAKHNDNMLLYGHSGVGKTFLSHCIAKEILDQGYSVIYLTSYRLFDILETKVFRPDQLDDISSSILSILNTCDLLIIDDLGTEMINKFTEVQLFSCMQERIRNNRSTIMSTNLSFDDINANYSERIFSRLTGYYKLVKLTGNDIRIKKAILEKQDANNGGRK